MPRSHCPSPRFHADFELLREYLLLNKHFHSLPFLNLPIRSSRHVPSVKYIRERVTKVSPDAVSRRVPFSTTKSHDLNICKPRSPLSVISSDRPSSPKGCLIIPATSIQKASTPQQRPQDFVLLRISTFKCHQSGQTPSPKQSSLVCSSLSQCSRYFASSMGLAQSSIMFHIQLELFSIFNTLCPSTDFVSTPLQTSRPSSDLKSHVKPLVKLQHENSKRNYHLKPVCRVGNQVSSPTHR